jgi:hypothetical protein
MLADLISDIVGVITYIRHDKKNFLGGPCSKTLTLKLTDNRFVVLSVSR